MKGGRHRMVGHMVWVLIAMAGVIGPPVAVVSAAVTGQGTISVKKETADVGGSVFTLEFRDADLKDVLRALGQENGMNVIIGEDVNGKLTLSFQRVTVQEAFNAILKINNLISFQDGTILRVIKSPFAEGENNMTTEIIPVNFATAKESADTVRTLLSKQGSVAIDTRTNSLIVRDIPDNVARIVSIVKSLDGRTPQVLIEARIVEAGTNFTRELGVQWGGNFLKSTSGGNYQVTGATRNPGGGSTAQPLTGGVGLSGNNFVVNLPATVAQGAGGALGFTFGNIASTRQLDIQLSAMEDSGQGRILSNPRVLTMDNKEARISSGTEIFVQTAVLSGTSTGTTSGSTSSGTSGANGVTKIDAKLELVVTPHITPDNRVVMHVKADKKEPDYNRQVQNIPPLTTRSAETDLLVKDGETIVIGGIYTRNESVENKGIPFLSRIPILGWLFKKETKVDNQSELLIFITPTIYKGN
ncbi:MAG: type IV pilus secretin PilQ [Nitrospirae bacterium]|nr:type IV pilus secretin PilQ [Nitrospirota bacterium]